MERPVIIFGTGGLARTALDIFLKNNVLVYAFLTEDEAEVNTEINDIIVMGLIDDDAFIKRATSDAEVFVALEDQHERLELAELLIKKYKKMPINAIHPSAQIAADVSLGHGNLIGAGTTIGAGVNLGSHNVISSGVHVEQQAKLAESILVGAGAVLGASSQTEKSVYVGSGAVIGAGVHLGASVKVGAGAVVIRSVEEGKTVFGNPAQEV
ncbi:MAG: acetyltransferase [Bacteroidota bacterium]